jgi:U3 small nucleolar RNA-associated protein 25
LKVSATYRGCLAKVLLPLRQVFERVTATSPAAAADERFDHFAEKVMPKLTAAASGGHVLIFIPSYHDYVRVRNFMKARALQFTSCCECT